MSVPGTRTMALTAGLALALLPFLAPRARAQTPPTATEIESYTGLHAAAARGDGGEIARLLKEGADPNVRDRNGRAPLHVAAFAGRADAVAALVAGGADHGLLDAGRYDAVTIAAVQDDLPTLLALLEAGASAALVTSRYDGTALIAAAHLGHADAVQALILAGAPLDHVNNLGWTALIEAVILGDGGARHQATVRALLQAGADRNLPDRNGVTPLEHARMKGYAAISALLAKAGAR